jgi:chemotaxis response regulator CheB
MIRVALVADNPGLMRSLLRAIIDLQDDMMIAGVVAEARAVDALDPDVLILDAEIAQIDAVRLFSDIVRSCKAPTIVMTTQALHGMRTAQHVLEMGAREMVLKPSIAVADDVGAFSAKILASIRAASANCC